MSTNPMPVLARPSRASAHRTPLSGSLGRMALVAALHVGALYLIATSLGVMPSLRDNEPPAVTLHDVPRAPPEPAPDVPRPRDYRPDLALPAPEVLPDPMPSATPITAELRDNPPVLPDPIPDAPDLRVGVRHDPRFPLSQPSYPARDIRDGNQGTVELEVYVLPTGRIGEVRVLKSAGSATLDQSAVEEAKRRWRMLPATRNGEPYAQWHRLKVTFNLANR